MLGITPNLLIDVYPSSPEQPKNFSGKAGNIHTDIQDGPVTELSQLYQQ